MAKPVIFTVDDEPAVLNALERDLRTHVKGTYRIITATSGKEAIESITELKKRNVDVPLIISDQRMPQMEGTDVLASVKKIYPTSKMMLLTAYADTDAAIQSINEIGLDYYLMKPWDPPKDKLFPIVDDLLADWNANNIPPYDGIRMIGESISKSTHILKEFLALNQIPYQWLDIQLNPDFHEMIDSLGKKTNLPVFFFTDGSFLSNPSPTELAEKIGLKTQAERPFYDVIIIGAGPAGLAAGVYGASEGLKTLMIEKVAPGGQAGTSSRIENYLGFPNGLSGADLARRAVTQAKRLGAELIIQEVTNVEVKHPYKIITLADGKELTCYALIMCSGVEVREFNVPGVANLNGLGVFYGAAMTEANLCKDNHIFILGGGNSAGQAAMFFKNIAKQVTIIIRKDSLTYSMSQYLIDRIDDSENVNVLTDTVITEVKGKGKLETICIKNLKTEEISEYPTVALFIFIGAQPRSQLIKKYVVQDPQGYILTGNDIFKTSKIWKGGNRLPLPLETSEPGIFAAGDIRSSSSKRVAAAVGEGAVAIRYVHEYLKHV